MLSEPAPDSRRCYRQDAMPSRAPDLFVQRIPGELLVYAPRQRTAHRLDRIATVVFDACDGETSTDTVIGQLRSMEPGSDAEELLRRVLEELLTKGLVVVPEGSSHLAWIASRRTLIAAGSRLALALPFISSVLAPTPAAAVSIAAGWASGLECPGPALDTEGYDHYEENPFREVTLHPTSTLGADVDTASYSNVRRFLEDGRLPPPEAVRLEELLNYFRYDDPEPTSSHDPLALRAELSPCPWHPRHELLRLGLQSPRVPTEDLPPRNLVFLLDVSGSMQAPSKLPLVKASMRRLVETLGERDSVAIVVYAGASGLVLEPTTGDRSGRILAALDQLEAGGSTNGGAGIELAYRLAERTFLPDAINRVILATDGDFNVGTTSRGALVRLIERKRSSGVFLSVLGFGTGNLKDSSMEQLAAHGNGNYAYIDSLAEARKVLVAEAGATLFTVARDVKLQLEWNPLQVAEYRLLGYENRLLAREDFDDDRRDSVEIGAGHHVTVLFEVVSAARAGSPRASKTAAPLRYLQTPRPTEAAQSGELGTLKLRYKPPKGGSSRLLSWTLDRDLIWQPPGAESDDFRLAAAVASFGLLLRRSKYRGEASYELAHRLAISSLGADFDGYRQELVSLIERAQQLDSGTAWEHDAD